MIHGNLKAILASSARIEVSASNHCKASLFGARQLDVRYTTQHTGFLGRLWLVASIRINAKNEAAFLRQCISEGANVKFNYNCEKIA